jgi:hypothetical protein
MKRECEDMQARRKVLGEDGRWPEYGRCSRLRKHTVDGGRQKSRLRYIIEVYIWDPSGWTISMHRERDSRASDIIVEKS